MKIFLNTYLNRVWISPAAMLEELDVLDACRRTRAGCRASSGTHRTCGAPPAPWQPRFRPHLQSGRWRILPRRFRQATAYPLPRENFFQVDWKDLESRWSLPCCTCHRKSRCSDFQLVPGTY